MIYFKGIDITKARENAGVTQRELAERMGVTQQRIAEMEKPEKEYCWFPKKFKLFMSYFTTS